MAFGFSASGSTPIYGMQERSQREGLRSETEALRRLEEKKKADRIASEKPDALKGFISNAARVYAAYQTGGASEATGLGKMGSRAIQGRRSDGSYYDDPMGDMIEVGARGYNMMEGMKQKDISDLKAEDIAAYNRDIAYAKSFAEGSPERKQALITARTSLEATQTAQDYGDRADTNPFLYTRGRKDTPSPDPIYFEGDKFNIPKAADKDIVPDEVLDGKTEAAVRRLAIAEEGFDRGPSPEKLDKGVRELREEDLLRSRIRAIPEEDRGLSGEDIDKGVREQQLRDKIASITTRDRGPIGEDLDKGHRGFMKEMMDREIDERSAEKLLDYDPALEKTTTEFKDSPMGITYLDKVAEEQKKGGGKAAKADKSYSWMDRTSDEKDRVSRVKTAKSTWRNRFIESGIESGILPLSLRDPLLVEDNIIKRRLLKREHEIYGSPLDLPRKFKKSPLRIKMDKIREERELEEDIKRKRLQKVGGILGSGGSGKFSDSMITQRASRKG